MVTKKIVNYRIVVHAADGKTTVHEQAKRPSLEDIRRGLNGGYAQLIVTSWHKLGRRAEVYVDEDGGPKALPPNIKGGNAIGWIGDYPLRGPIVVIEKLTNS